MDRILDRVVQFDERSRLFGVAAVTPAVAPRSYTWASYEVLDQGAEGACVGFGWSGELLAKPVVVKGITNAFARGVYLDAQKVDDTPGENYEGTSVLAGAKVITTRGYQRGYRWGFNLDDLVLALGHTGPAVLGLNWYTGMMDPDSAGYIHPSGQVEGGHCIVATGVSVTKRRITLVNSWGPDWGKGGRCYVGFTDMERLLREDGEQCFPAGRQTPH